ncbi:annexin D1-like [Phalaenopsis equestris]|uniref:annexin D1-like n=1 Tax=Phalaenopsis equestris TaxID=78828 RepID=UPI0009E4B7CA|nr:annexin D1-like [Phalaenopsis equestris]
MSTLSVPECVPPASEDAEQLRKAFEGWGTNEGLIISILAHRSADQRRQIRQAYSNAFGEDILKALGKELTNDFEEVVRLWVLDPVERDAVLAFESVKRWRPGDRALIEIACARSSEEILEVRRAYHALYKRSIEEDVAANAKGDFRKLLLPLLTAYRYGGPEVNLSLAKSEAKQLHDKIGGKAYADEEVIRVLTTRSKAQLEATFNAYYNEFGHSINKDLKSDPKDELLSALRAITKCITCQEKYFEKTIRLAINKMGTEEGAVTRVIATRVEVDMKSIKELYFKKNGVPLVHAIKKDTIGDYEDFLVAIIGEESA